MAGRQIQIVDEGIEYLAESGMDENVRKRKLKGILGNLTTLISYLSSRNSRLSHEDSISNEDLDHSVYAALKQIQRIYERDGPDHHETCSIIHELNGLARKRMYWQKQIVF